jgi:hypothetical protein
MPFGAEKRLSRNKALGHVDKQAVKIDRLQLALCLAIKRRGDCMVITDGEIDQLSQSAEVSLERIEGVGLVMRLTEPALEHFHQAVQRRWWRIVWMYPHTVEAAKDFPMMYRQIKGRLWWARDLSFWNELAKKTTLMGDESL